MKYLHSNLIAHRDLNVSSYSFSSSVITFISEQQHRCSSYWHELSEVAAYYRLWSI